MGPLEIGGLGALALIVLIVAKIPIGFAMIIVGVGGFALQAGLGPALTLLATEPAGILASPDLAAIPLFLLMGSFASAAGFSSDLYRAAAAFLGHRPGGLAYATIGGCAAFGAVCGSSTATAATFTRAALPEMLRFGYSTAFATGTIAAGGTLKSLIPPSIIMILYCITAKTFIFDLFAASIIPALIAIALNMLAIWLVVRISPAEGPAGERLNWPERWIAIRRALPVLALMLAIFVGLYSGIFTVNEAASLAAILAFALAVVRRRLTWTGFWSGLIESAAATGMIYFIIIGAMIFTYFISLARVPEALIALVSALNLPPIVVIAILLLGYLVLGAIFDEISAMLITLPFVLPVIVKLGYDPVWWGVVNVVIIELGMIIPPIGMIVFIIHGMRPDISLSTIYRGVVPFIVADLMLLAVLVIFPKVTALIR